MQDVAVVVLTVDREPAYLPGTLANLARAGVFRSDRLHSVHVVDSGRVREGVAPWPDRGLRDWAYEEGRVGRIDPTVALQVHRTAVPRSAKQNCAAALRIGAASGAAWVLQLEDDLDVCGDFLGSVGRWLDAHERVGGTLYPFSGDNAQIEQAAQQGRACWDYPVRDFWGFQCFAVRPDVAVDVAAWFELHPVYRHADGRPDENAHDLEIHHWAAARGETRFTGSAPSFVQHVGLATSIAGNVQGGHHVRFPSWRGPDWAYEKKD